MTMYVVELNNLTMEPWCFGAYQELPEITRLDSVIWQAARVNVGTKTAFQWGMNYGAALTQFTGNHVTDLQSVPAKIGDTYQVITRDGTNMVDPVPISTGGPAGYFTIVNNTDPANPVSVGSTLSESINAAMNYLDPKQPIHFPASKRYVVALYRDVRVGDLAISVKPATQVNVNYPPGSTRAIVTAYTEAGTTMLKVEYVS